MTRDQRLEPCGTTLGREPIARGIGASSRGEALANEAVHAAVRRGLELHGEATTRHAPDVGVRMAAGAWREGAGPRDRLARGDGAVNPSAVWSTIVAETPSAVPDTPGLPGRPPVSG